MKRFFDWVTRSRSTRSTSSASSSSGTEVAVSQVALSTSEQTRQWLVNSEVGRDPATIVLDYLQYCMTIAQTWKQAADGFVLGLLSLPNGEIASCHSGHHNICIWREGALFKELVGHTSSPRCLALLPSGDMASGSYDKTVKLWRNGECIQTLEQGSPVYSLCVLRNGDLVRGLNNGSIKVWRDGQCVSTLQGHSDVVNTMLALPNGVEFASGSLDKTIRIWRDGVCRQVLQGHTNFILALACLASGELLSGSNDKTIKIWRNGACIQTLREHTDGVDAVLVLPNGDWLSGANDDTVKLWNSNGVCLKTVEMGCGVSRLTLVDALHVVVGLRNGEMKAMLL